MRPGVPGEGGTGTGANEEQQGPTASERKRALPEALMEEVIEPKNLNRAYQRVKANKGAPAVDGMSVDDLGGWLAEHREELSNYLKTVRRQTRRYHSSPQASCKRPRKLDAFLS